MPGRCRRGRPRAHEHGKEVLRKQAGHKADGWEYPTSPSTPPAELQKAVSSLSLPLLFAVLPKSACSIGIRHHVRASLCAEASLPNHRRPEDSHPCCTAPRHMPEPQTARLMAQPPHSPAPGPTGAPDPQGLRPQCARSWCHASKPAIGEALPALSLLG